MNIMTVISLILLIAFIIPVGYLLLLAIASVHQKKVLTAVDRQPMTRFMIAIPAHDEGVVIQDTVKRLLSLNYPVNMFDVHIVADHCTDDTAFLAEQAGALVHERNEGPRSGKGAALSWLFKRVLEGQNYDAVVVFDADTQVDSNFLRIVDARFVKGDRAVQGKHIISNADQGWFPALTWAMFLVDNRYQNLGRSNLGWSAKNMGDSICFNAQILRELGWGEGLTEDYQLRQRLLLEGVRIVYEPSAMGFGEAPITWKQARAQRTRWLLGTHHASQAYGRRLLTEGIRRRSSLLMDGALQTIFPSYSTLTLIALLFLAVQLIIQFITGLNIVPSAVLWSWIFLVVLLFLYPFFGLLLERAPLKAYLVLLTGPLFIIWRTWLAFSSRFTAQKVTWVRTEHGVRK